MEGQSAEGVLTGGLIDRKNPELLVGDKLVWKKGQESGLTLKGREKLVGLVKTKAFFDQNGNLRERNFGEFVKKLGTDRSEFGQTAAELLEHRFEKYKVIDVIAALDASNSPWRGLAKVLAEKTSESTAMTRLRLVPIILDLREQVMRKGMFRNSLDMDRIANDLGTVMIGRVHNLRRGDGQNLFEGVTQGLDRLVDEALVGYLVNQTMREHGVGERRAISMVLESTQGELKGIRRKLAKRLEREDVPVVVEHIKPHAKISTVEKASVLREPGWLERLIGGIPKKLGKMRSLVNGVRVVTAATVILGLNAVRAGLNWLNTSEKGQGMGFVEGQIYIIPTSSAEQYMEATPVPDGTDAPVAQITPEPTKEVTRAEALEFVFQQYLESGCMIKIPVQSKDGSWMWILDYPQNIPEYCREMISYSFGDLPTVNRPVDSWDDRLQEVQFGDKWEVALIQFKATCYLHSIILAMEALQVKLDGHVSAIPNPFVLAEALPYKEQQAELIKAFLNDQVVIDVYGRETSDIAEFASFNMFAQMGTEFAGLLRKLGYELQESKYGMAFLRETEVDGNRAKVLAGVVPDDFKTRFPSGTVIENTATYTGDYLQNPFVLQVDESEAQELRGLLLREKLQDISDKKGVPIIGMRADFSGMGHAYIVLGVEDDGVLVTQGHIANNPDAPRSTWNNPTDWPYYMNRGLIPYDNGLIFVPWDVALEEAIGIEELYAVQPQADVQP